MWLEAAHLALEAPLLLLLRRRSGASDVTTPMTSAQAILSTTLYHSVGSDLARGALSQHAVPAAAEQVDGGHLGPPQRASSAASPSRGYVGEKPLTHL